MDVWADQTKNLESELISSGEARKYLTEKEIKEVFDYNKMLDNVDYIFARSVENNI